MISFSPVLSPVAPDLRAGNEHSGGIRLERAQSISAACSLARYPLPSLFLACVFWRYCCRESRCFGCSSYSTGCGGGGTDVARTRSRRWHWNPPDVAEAVRLFFGLRSADGFASYKRLLGNDPRERSIEATLQSLPGAVSVDQYWQLVEERNIASVSPALDAQHFDALLCPPYGLPAAHVSPGHLKRHQCWICHPLQRAWSACGRGTRYPRTSR